MILFIHIPKCGGNSIIEILKTQYPVCVDLVEDEAPGKPDVGYGHIDPFEHIENDFQFTFLRNPIERCLSLYRYIMHLEGEGWERYEALGIRKDMTPHRFFSGPLFAGVDNGMTRQLSGQSFLHESQFRPVNMQDYYLASSFCNQLDFVGLIEDFNGSVERLSELLGWEDFRIPHLNSSPDLDGIDKRLLSLIGDCNRYDIRLYRTVIQCLLR